MKIKLLAINLVFSLATIGQQSDLFYQNDNKKKPEVNAKSNLQDNKSGGQKFIQLNYGDARSIFGIGFTVNSTQKLAATYGIHFGRLSYPTLVYSDISNSTYKIDEINLLNLSMLFRYRPKHFYIKFGPYFNIPIGPDLTNFYEEFIPLPILPGFLFGMGFELKNGIDIGVTQPLDLLFIGQAITEQEIGQEISELKYMRPRLSVSYHFGKPKYNKTKKINKYAYPPIIDDQYYQPAITPVKNKTDYSKFSLEELKTKLKLATDEERYEDANEIQNQINIRQEEEKYKKLSLEELKRQLENAIKNEDYSTAEALQKEIDNRSKNNNPNDKSQNQNKTKNLNELEADLKKALENEDFKKADEIQKEINKLKNNKN